MFMFLINKLFLIPGPDIYDIPLVKLITLPAMHDGVILLLGILPVHHHQLQPGEEGKDRVHNQPTAM